MRPLALAAIGLLLACALDARSQPAARLHRICLIANAVPLSELLDRANPNPAAAAIAEGLRERGWEEGRNILLVWKSAEGDYSRWPALVDECLRERTDVLVTFHYAVAKLAMQKNRSLPIVMVTASNLFTQDLAASFARPGRNATGIAGLPSGGIDGKRLQLLKAIDPRVTRIGLLWQVPPSAEEVMIPSRWAEPSRNLHVAIVPLPFSNVDEIEAVVGNAVKQGLNGLIVGNSPPLHRAHIQERIHAIAARHSLPALHEVLSAAETGGLVAYAADLEPQYRRTGYFIDRILTGTKPGDIPIEQPTQMKLYVNLRTAKRLGLSIPAAVITEAARVIE